ncbi:oligopeptide transport system substrate-binding protein [Amycolatopsis xylanica]|uniref:Oligopeptide transport system substrate-binding protein n=1 Tax=Amycolatopsis xylanica TaxID=589385 RepID=A0A1H3ENF8_9PSEU|nr:ABC transporter substrate-binding protein [Amycolatopsis xylanica]SDX79499.1 oligopeptide transport system substrate-binding protein [Amycolatopsis xylanica]
MGRSRRISGVAAAVTSLVLVLAACGGGGGKTEDKGQQAGGETNPDGAVSVYGTEPQNTFIPSNTTELGGSKVLNPVFSQLIEYRSDTGAPFNLVAESITTNDAKVYDIKLKKGWKFHDGTEVKAHNFVDAWNYGAYGPNGQLSGDFFAQIEGYEAVNPGKDKQPTTDKMSGLKVLGDYEFQVTLSAPFSVFLSKIGYLAFAPLPDVFFKDPKAFAEHPIGNGPMKFVSRQPKVNVKLTRNDDYQGEDKVHFKDLEVRIYSSLETAYQDLLSNKLDFMETLPPSATAGGKYKTDLKDRVVEGHLLGISTLGVPYYVPEYNNLDLRKAISLAINREQITKTVMNDTYAPADSWVSAGIEGYRPGTCGEFCKYDAAKAKEYLAKSGFKGKLTIQSNADGGRKEPLVAACNSIKNALGVECDFVPAAGFNQHRQIVTGKKLTGMSRSDWAADYPSIEDFLNPIYRTGAGSNDSGYSNPAVDEALKKADSTADKAEAIKLYQQVEDMIAKDLPQIPVWDEKGVGAKSSRLKSAKLDFGRYADYSSIEVAR